MNSVRIELDCAAISPGERIAGQVRIDNLRAGTRDLEVRLTWATAGKGTTDTSTVMVERIALSAEHPAARFALGVPPFPWSYNGTLLSIVWRVEAAVWGSANALASVPFVSAPCGRPVTGTLET